MSDQNEEHTGRDASEPDENVGAGEDAWSDAGAIEVTEEDLERGEVAVAEPEADRPDAEKPSPVDLAMDTEHADDVTATDAEAKWNEEAELAQRGARSKTIALWGSRSLVGVVALAAATVLGFGTVWAMDGGIPETGETRAFDRFTPQTGTQQIVCPPQQVRIGVPGNADVRLPVGSGGPVIGEFEGAETGEIPLVGVEDVALTTVTASSSEEQLTGIATSRASVEDVEGLGAEACTAAAWEQWLVGGSTITGRQTSIVIANPGEQQARVSLEIFGQDDTLEPATTGVVVEPGTAELLDVAAYSVGNANPAVRVVSEGGAVAAFLQQSTIRTLDPGGIDTTSATVAVSGSQSFLGVPVAAGHTHTAEEQFEDAGPVLRMIAPGEDTEVDITFDSGDGEPLVTTMNLSAGRVTELPLTELGAGHYSITIESDAAVAAGVRFTPTEGAPADDFAWMAPSRTIDGEVRLALPWENRELQLHVMNAGDEPETVTIGDRERELAPGETVSVGVSQDEIVFSGESIRASVTYEAEGRAVGFAVPPLPTAASSILVEY